MDSFLTVYILFALLAFKMCETQWLIWTCSEVGIESDKTPPTGESVGI